LSNSDIGGRIYSLLEVMDEQQWLGFILVQEWPKTRELYGIRWVQDATVPPPPGLHYYNKDVGGVG